MELLSSCHCSKVMKWCSGSRPSARCWLSA